MDAGVRKTGSKKVSNTDLQTGELSIQGISNSLSSTGSHQAGFQVERFQFGEFRQCESEGFRARHSERVVSEVDMPQFGVVSKRV